MESIPSEMRDPRPVGLITEYCLLITDPAGENNAQNLSAEATKWGSEFKLFGDCRRYIICICGYRTDLLLNSPVVLGRIIGMHP